MALTLAANPRFAPALRALAVNEMSMGRVPQAKTHFEALLQFSPQEAIAHLALGEIYYAEKNHRQSILHYEQSGGLHQRDTANLIKYADACLNTEQPEKACALLLLAFAAGTSASISAQRALPCDLSAAEEVLCRCGVSI